jgi:D-alanine--poly(phosphoribitol) ligase subunit 2
LLDLMPMIDQQVLDVLAEVTGSDLVRSEPGIHLYDLGLLDSLRTVELLIALSDELGVEIAPSEVDREAWATPRDIVALMGAKMASA